MRTTTILERISKIGKSNKDMSAEISIIEASMLVDKLIARYDILQTTDILSNFTKSPELGVMLQRGVRVLNDQIATIEKAWKDTVYPCHQDHPRGLKTPPQLR